MFKYAKKYTVPLMVFLLIGGAASIFGTRATQKSENFAEVGYTEVSPRGSASGEIIPASCPSDLHDDPYYGTSCSTCNACGSCASGAYNCGGACGATAPANPSGYGNTCMVTNVCGYSYPVPDPVCSMTCSGAVQSTYVNDGYVMGYLGPDGITYYATCEAASASWCTDPSNTTLCRVFANQCTTPTSPSQGVIQCNGTCSGSMPPNPVGHGNSCTGPANSCGATNSGTLTCSGGNQTLYCTATTAPPEPIAPATCSCPVPSPNYGNSCTSSANICGFTNTGTIQCNGTCGATPPPDSTCSSTCGNAVCDAHETSTSCPADCAASTTPVTGWGWSDTIGWISLNCSDLGTCATRNYALRKNTSNKLIGYAWSENVGWISANTSDLAGCPSGTCEASVSSLGRVSGWLKAVNAGGGWDGWIALNGTNYQTMLETDNTLSNWAWGSDVTGWILWSAHLPCAQTAGDFCSGDLWQHRHPNCTVGTVIDCAPSTCSSATNQCIVIPPPSATASTTGLKATPQLVSPGATSVITWNIKNATSCTVTGNGNSWTGVTGTQTTNPINAVTTYTLNCSGLGGNLTQTAIIKFAPKWQEN